MSASAQSMFDFFVLLMQKVPEFLMSEPVCYIMGLCFGVFAVGLVGRMLHITD